MEKEYQSSKQKSNVEENKKLTETLKKLSDQQNQAKIAKGLSTKEKTDLKSLVASIEEKE
tara:strand:+ start:1514 stop:1693 length:180 start_codon:yes stop_codon:yes gene_type:complete